jgi:hypothetical protein
MSLPKFTAEASLSIQRRAYAESHPRSLNADAISPSASLSLGAIANYLLPHCPIGTWECYHPDTRTWGCCAFLTHWDGA